MEQWDVELHRRVAGAIKRLRGARSAQWLADRTAELGYPISRAQIANYESGRKKGLDLPELLVIAAALDTSPVVLLYPGPYELSVSILPDEEVQMLDAAQWFSGEMNQRVSRSLHPSAGTGDEAREKRDGALRWVESTRPLRLWRELNDALEMRLAIISRGETERDRDQIAFYDSQIQRLQQEISSGDLYG
ncbi:hypothetical protein CYL16_04810 [Mycobacterium sp. EPG1]|nr:hypothetical protein CYL16_04810 [Mycobacterium sp. EPG1]